MRLAPMAIIHVSEMDSQAADVLAEKYRAHPNVSAYCEDALGVGCQSSNDFPKFDRIIANPLYMERGKLLRGG